MENNTFNSSSVNMALQRIRNTLAYSLKENYGITDDETIDKFLKLHGLDKARFDFINNFETLIENGVVDESVDTNANKCDVSITGMLAETAMPINKLVGYRYLYRKLKDMYGKKRAKYLTGRMYDMSLALADSTNILKMYCFSINASKLVYEGRPWGSLPSAPPHRIDSYIHALCETVHQLSNHLAGAIAVGSFQFDLAHIILYREHKTLTDIREDKVYRKYIENSLQSFIHSVNMLSRNSVESPFTNISVHDRPKLRGFIADDNMGWYFDKDDITDGVPTNAIDDCGDGDWKEYVVNVILELQEIYCEIMDRGDVLHDNRPIEFPVCTINISRAKDENGNYYFEDTKFIDDFCNRHDTPRYNIYVSEGNKIASCCFSKDQVFTYYDKENNVVITSFEEFAKDYLSEGTTPEEKHIENSEKYVVDPQTGEKSEITGVIRLNNNYQKLIEIELEDGSIMKVTPNQKLWDNNSQSLVEASKIMENPELYDI